MTTKIARRNAATGHSEILPAAADTPGPGRILQVDFFRGIALLIIFINHMPFNDVFYLTPSRFGFSDAAETFVYLSGFAAALAFGRSFERAGIGLGTLRVLHRCGQVYACHLGLFFLLAAICVLGNQAGSEVDYIHRLYIDYFFDHTDGALAGLVSLRYVPNFFDILPMYLVIMLWVPVVWALSRVRRSLALAFPVALYALSWRFGWELPADPASDRPWFFNPFNWQLMFFTGFAFASGWLAFPRPTTALRRLCLAVVMLSIPLAHEPTYRLLPFLAHLRQFIEPLVDKSHLGLLRWVHFLALAYLMNLWFRQGQHWHQRALVQRIALMGRQSLPMFMFCMALSYVAGMVLDWSGRDVVSLAWVNLSGLALMLATGSGLAWLAGKPWKQLPAQARPEAPPAWRWCLSGSMLRPALVAAGLCGLTLAPALLIQLPSPEQTVDNAQLSQDFSRETVVAPGELDPGAPELVEWQDGV